MEHTHQYHARIHHSPTASDNKQRNILRLALSATLHCLLGCGFGEVAGMMAATYFEMTMTGSMILAILLGFVFGFALGVIPLLRKGFTFSKALKIVLVAEGLSIAVMEAFELYRPKRTLPVFRDSPDIFLQ